MSTLFLLSRKTSLHLAAVATVALSFSGAGNALADSAETDARTIRWVVAHDRGSSPFLDLNKDFARRLTEKSGGKLKIEFIKSAAPESALDEDAYAQVVEGKADMSQLAASGAKVHVFDMPFIFRNYDHAEAVFASPVGKKIVAEVAAASNGKIRGLAFTYSGGYRILVGKIALRSAADFKNARMRSSTSYLVPFMQELGATPIDAGAPSRERPIAGLVSGDLDLEETEINRLAIVEKEHPDLLKQIGFVNLTRHRMYVTAIVANEKFLASLSKKLRTLLVSEMQELAVAERKLSIDMEGRNLDLLTKKGLHFVDYPKSELKALMTAGEVIHAQHPEMAGLIQEIRAIKEPARLAHN